MVAIGPSSLESDESGSKELSWVEG